MIILLISDSHSYNEELDFILTNIKYDLVIHCGDCNFDIQSTYHNVFDYIVRGNHDENYLPINQSLTINDNKILITHGHKYNVYQGYDDLVKYMNKKNYNICFHGHTHVPHIEKYQNKLFINPGSVMYNRGNSECGSYAIIEINNTISVNFYNSRTLKKIPQSIIDKDRDILDEFKLITKK